MRTWHVELAGGTVKATFGMEAIMIGPMWNSWVKAYKEGRLKPVTKEEARQMREEAKRAWEKLTQQERAERERRWKEEADSVDDWGV